MNVCSFGLENIVPVSTGEFSKRVRMKSDKMFVTLYTVYTIYLSHSYNDISRTLFANSPEIKKYSLHPNEQFWHMFHRYYSTTLSQRKPIKLVYAHIAHFIKPF